MAAAALKRKFEPQLKTFHATILVTRAEEWCVEAETAEQARELLAAGQGHRCHLGSHPALNGAHRRLNLSFLAVRRSSSQGLVPVDTPKAAACLAALLPERCMRA